VRSNVWLDRCFPKIALDYFTYNTDKFGQPFRRTLLVNYQEVKDVGRALVQADGSLVVEDGRGVPFPMVISKNAWIIVEYSIWGIPVLSLTSSDYID
jgi:hypothetical protein